MPKRLRSVWITFQETPLFGLNLAGYESDSQGVRAELEAAEAWLCRQPRGSALVALDLAYTDMLPEIAAFLRAHAGQPEDPIRKLAIVGVPGWQRAWYRWVKKVAWPKHARFFMEHEAAKAWLIAETF